MKGERMEEIRFEDFDAEEVQKSRRGYKSRYSYPTCSIGESKIIFNKSAAHILPPKTKAIKWFVSADYVFAFPAEAGDSNGYAVMSCSGEEGKGSLSACIPRTMLHEKRLKPGHRKVYKCKNGIAFSRYETIS
jgi:hypothetical protein